MDWNPSPLALVVEAVEGDADRPGTLLVEHCNDPYEVPLDAADDAAVQAAAHEYLAALQLHPDLGARLKLPDPWLPALVPDAHAQVEPFFGWLPFEPAAQGFIGPYGSFRFRSGSDHLAVLFAGERLAPDHYTGSGFGLAVVAHLRTGADGTLRASFVGLTATLPHGRFRAHALTAQRARAFAGLFTPENLYRSAAVEALAASAGLQDFAVRGVRIAASRERWWIERGGVAVRRPVDQGASPAHAQEVPYAVTVLSTGGHEDEAHEIAHVAPLVADAAGDARVFEQDAPSALGRLVRPTRDETVLDAARGDRNIFPGSNSGPLAHPPGAPLVQVLPCPRFVPADRPLNPTQPRQVTLTAGGPPVRSDDASAVQPFFHARDLLQRLERYGWTNPAAYFRLTQPALRIFYRSAIVPGPGKDGRSVNARVIPQGWPAGAVARQPDDDSRPAIDIHLAWADLRRRERARWQQGDAPQPAVPLGIGADPRWLWHEFGHVLLVASTGELEFRFAHSAGDALAAIVADPASALPAALRGATFPFAFLPRRHCRCAVDGWSWTGTLHAALAQVPAAQQPRRKGYASEQILSSSLFRLYRCIGGATRDAALPPQDALHERLRASHYALYLILQAMQLMGDARIHAIATPAQFVHLLQQADRQPGTWTASFAAATFTRVGGTLAKVIRWAFEAQGLHGDGNGPGAAPPVDIYIADGRPTHDEPLYGSADYGRGSYVPVSLHWQAAGAQATPLWQADPAEGIVGPDAAGHVEVRVGNRGAKAAAHVAVQLWVADWPQGSPAPAWDTGSGAWTACAATGPATRTIPPGLPSAQAAFTFTLPAGAGRRLLLAQASCPDDRANTEPALGLACGFTPTPLADLVANDNNLALRVL